MRYTFIIAIILGIAAKANAQTSQDSVAQKYNLFHPTPKDQMRSFETDRPDATESPVTVDAGHFQFETDLFRTERLKTHGIETIRNFYNAFNMKLGITNTLDLQLIVEPFYTQKVSGNGYTHKSSGFGSLTLRAKQNLWGDNGGKTALALLPFINIPTASGEKLTGGLVVPFGVSLPCEWSFGTQAEIDFEQNLSGNGHHVNYLVSATTSHPLVGNVDFFAEGLLSRETEQNAFEYYLNTGLVYPLKDNIRLDAGGYFSLKDSSPTVYFLGLSFRL